MADGQVQVQPDSTGKRIDTTEATRPDSTVVEQQRVAIVRRSGDLFEAAELASLELLVVMKDVRELLRLIASAILDTDVDVERLR